MLSFSQAVNSQCESKSIPRCVQSLWVMPQDLATSLSMAVCTELTQANCWTIFFLFSTCNIMQLHYKLLFLAEFAQKVLWGITQKSQFQSRISFSTFKFSTPRPTLVLDSINRLLSRSDCHGKDKFSRSMCFGRLWWYWLAFKFSCFIFHLLVTNNLHYFSLLLPNDMFGWAWEKVKVTLVSKNVPLLFLFLIFN